jgi:hypothetical protein
MPFSLQELSDLTEIRALRDRFGQAVDARDWAALDALFTPTVDVDLSAFGVPAGPMPRDALVSIFGHSFRDPAVKTMQVYSGAVITLTGDTATAVTQLYGHHHHPEAPGGDTFELRALYHDGLSRTPEGWRIASTRLQVSSMIGNIGLVS